MTVYVAAKPKVTCPCCERPFCIRLDGRLTKHRLDGWESTVCDGSDRFIRSPMPPPWPHVPAQRN